MTRGSSRPLTAQVVFAALAEAAVNGVLSITPVAVLRRKR